MNEDLQYFLAILAIFYLYEATYWIRPGGLLFRSHFGEPHRLLGLFRNALLQNDHGGFLLGNLLPLGTSAQAQFWPVSLSPQGVLAYVSQSLTPEGRPDQPGHFYRYDDIATVQAQGRQVRINGKHFVTVSSHEQAQRLASLILRLCAFPEDRRATEIDAALALATNLEEVTTRYRTAWWDSLVLMFLCTLVLAYIFAFIPYAVTTGWKMRLQEVLVVHYGLERTESTILAYALYFLFLSLLTMIAYLQLACSLPGHQGSLFGQCLLILLFPPSTMHARNHLFRLLLAPYHPLVIARALCWRSDFRAFAEHVVRDLEYPLEPLCPGTDEGAIATEAWFRSRLAARLKEVIEQAGVPVAACLETPARENPNCQAYCQRCRAQFELVSGTCHQCRDRQLVPLPERVEPVVTPTVAAVVPVNTSQEKKPEPVPVSTPIPARTEGKRQRGKKRKKR
jgi:hypothetical protein